MNPKNKWLLGVVTAAVLATVSQFEGKSNDPYFDIVGVQTVCDGQTNVPMRHYSDAECAAMLKASLVKYGNGILQCISVPITSSEHAAYTSFSYNVGVQAFCKSSLLKKLNAGDHYGACDGLLAWDKAAGKEVVGLLNRRKGERELCLKELKNV